MPSTKKPAASGSPPTVDRIAEIAKEVLGDAVSCSYSGMRSVRFSVGEKPVVDIERMAMTAHYPVWFSQNLRRRSKALRSEADVRKVFADIRTMREKDADDDKAARARNERRHALGEALEGVPVPPWCVIFGNLSPPDSGPRPYRVTVKLDLPTEDQAIEVARAIATLATTLDVTQDGSQRDTAAATDPTE